MRLFQFIRRTIPYSTSEHIKLTIYRSCILSVLLYCSPGWFPGRSDIVKLEHFQRRAVTWISGSGRYQLLLVRLKILPICYQFKILPICYQLLYIDMVLLWKIMNRKTDLDPDLYLCSFTPNEFNTRIGCSQLFRLKKTRKFQCDQNFFCESTSQCKHSSNSQYH